MLCDDYRIDCVLIGGRIMNLLILININNFIRKKFYYHTMSPFIVSLLSAFACV